MRNQWQILLKTSDHFDRWRPNLLLILGAILLEFGTLQAQTNSFEAEARANTISGSATIQRCSQCSGHRKVGLIGNGSDSFVTFNHVNVSAAGNYELQIDYLVNGTRSFFISVNGGSS